MIRPLELFIALRYARSRDTGFFVSFITWVSLGGVALGVLALITILSVMNGFEGELRERLLSLSAHATLTRVDGGAIDPGSAPLAMLRRYGVTGLAPFNERQALIAHGEGMSSAVLRGIDPAQEPNVSAIGKALLSGSLAELVPDSNRLLLGRMLAYELGATIGDEVTVMVPAGDADGELTPRIRVFRVAGIFEVGLQDNDSVLALANLADVGSLAGKAGATGLRLRFQDVFAAPAASRAIAGALGPAFTARDWTVENSGYFRAIRIEKTMMTLILLLVVGVAAFNIVATLVMVVRAKRNDIAILRTLGLEPHSVVAVFLTQGAVIGWLGTLIGATLGLALSYNVSTVAAFLERVLHFQFFDSDVYYLTRIPSEVQAGDVVLVVVTALALTLLATVYPALRAARTEPAEALRYE